MRIGIAWAKAILPVGLMLVATAAQAQYAPSPYATPGAMPGAMPGGAPVQPIFYDQGGYAQPQAMPAPEDYAEPGGVGYELGDDGRPLPYLGRDRAYGTGGIAHPRWFDVSADYMIINRDNGARFEPFSSLGAGGATVLSSDNLNFDGASGFRVTGNYLVGAGRNLEASYFGTFNFATAAQAASDGNLLLFSPFSNFGAVAATDFDAADLQTITYSTNLHSAEINLRQRWISPNARVQSSLLAGVRYLCIDEDFELRAFSAASSGQYLARTSNDLVGFQLGGDILTAVIPRIKFGAEAKAGIFGNDAQLRNIITQTNALAGTITTNEASDTNNASFVGEAGVFMIVHLTPRWNAKAGYQALVATGLALAPENFDRNPAFGARPVVMNDGGHAFYHGGQMGIEFLW